jgi:hypothetical protein
MLDIERETPGAAEIENLFTGITDALRVAIKLRDVKITPDGNGCHIRSRDRYGSLPEIHIPFSKNNEHTLDSISVCIARLGMAARFRQELANRYFGCRFLRPISNRKSTLVGFQAGGMKIVAKGADPCFAYQELKKAAESSLKIAS